MDREKAAALRRGIGMLESILVRQIDLHREMLALAEDKREAIIAGNLEKLEKTVAEEKRLVSGIAAEEKRRLAVMPLIKAGLGLDDSPTRLGELLPGFPEPEGGRLAGIAADLRAAVEAVQVRNRHNAELLRTSLAHVESFLRSLAGAVRAGANYRGDGGRAAPGPAILDRSA
ncbi:MAG: flagellar protein FlgN [Planctomycetota bacterium]|jgi:flagellar biosynthesis/type III secretory pathway chaperone|nr:flagellar protein FlgN [Planctomycetota bacterium]